MLGRCEKRSTALCSPPVSCRWLPHSVFQFFPPKHVRWAALAFYDSPFDDATVFSYDRFVTWDFLISTILAVLGDRGVAGSGGFDGHFNVYRASYTHGIMLEAQLQLNLGLTYSLIGAHIEDVAGRQWIRDIQSQPELMLSIPGKAMAYAGLGRVREEWIATIEALYRYDSLACKDATQEEVDAQLSINGWPAGYTCAELGVSGLCVSKNSHAARTLCRKTCNLCAPNRMDGWADELGVQPGLPRAAAPRKTVHGQLASEEDGRDLAATSQHVFSKVVFDVISNFSDHDTNIILAGGCALNVRQSFDRTFDRMSMHLAIMC